ncbi:MAG: hypothetical protein AB1424_04760 [Thermodesulfobacteriota bacterium]
MMKTLVSIEVDLAASRAIRFASQLNFFIPMEIHPVYVKESPPRELSIGSGWARKHWEQELVREGKAEIREMISSEWEFSPTLKEPLVVYGDRERELLKIMETERFAVFVDGERFDWTPANLYRKCHSKLWQQFPGVIGIARVLRKIEALLVLCPETSGVQPLVQSLSLLWKGSSLPVSLAIPRGAPADLAQEAARAKETLAKEGCQVSLQADFPYYPEPPAPGFLRKYGLVALALNRSLKKDSPELEWLSQANAPLLIKLY